jgi:predicted HTH transcriptional regulator
MSELPARFLYHDIYDGYEDERIEFKRSFNKEYTQKYLETMCAFLNNKGGHIIFGINDKSGRIDGFQCSNKLFDEIQLFVDQSYNFIVRTNNTIVHNKLFTIRNEPITKNLSVVVISCVPEKDTSYKLMNGNTYYRMNASNRRVRDVKLYTEHDMKLIQQQVDNYNQLYVSSLKELKQTKKNYEQIKQHMNEFEKNHKDVIIQINDSLYDYYHVHQKPVKMFSNQLFYFIVIQIIIIVYLILFNTSI